MPIDPFISSMNSQVSAAIRGARSYMDQLQQGQQSGGSYPPGTYPPPGYGGMPWGDASGYQGMAGQQQQMMMMFTLLATLLQHLKDGGSFDDLDDSGLSNTEINMLQGLLPNLFNTNDTEEDEDTTSAGVRKALEALDEALDVSGNEVDGDDDDERAISQDDLDDLKGMIDDEDFTREDLTRAIQLKLYKGKSKDKDELISLLKLDTDNALVDFHDFLKPGYLSKLSSSIRTDLADVLVDKDLGTTDSPDTETIQFLMYAVNGDVSTKVRDFARKAVKELVAKNILDPSIDSAIARPNRDRLVNLLKLMNFKFDSSGTLLPDDDQPFDIGVSAEASV